MMNKKTAIIIGLQAFLIVVLFWMLVFYGKDEYENFRTEQEEEIESLNRVVEEEGISIVSLSPAVQKNSGISTAKVTQMAYKGEIKSFGTVVPIDTLIQARTNLVSINTELAALRETGRQLQAQYDRLKSLNADDKNVSDLSVQQALASLNTNKVNINSQSLAMTNLEANTKLQWGEALAKIALSSSPSPLYNQLLTRQNVLIQVSLPLIATNPSSGDTVKITPLNGIKAINAIYISAATKADTNSSGKTFYFSAPAESLRVGMRVSVESIGNKKSINNGIVIPSSAVVWYAGTPWSYFKEDNNQFIRKPISADIEVDAGWFNEGLDADSEVVVKGAQLLLSEEFKYLIKNENDD
jgi:hypothetical protein